MSAKTIRAFAVSVLLMAGGMDASAETPTEEVTVSATRLREVFHEFLKAFVAPTRMTGKIARWERRVCPVVLGQKPNYARFITQRVMYTALAAGAPVNTEPSCTPNIEIIFTTTPQALLDDVRKNHPLYLGYADSNSQLEKLATVTRPVQAWYTTETRTANGRRWIDSVLLWNSGGNLIYDPPISVTTGSGRIANGINSGFNHILIVIDSTKLAGEKIVPLSDYISMLALTQLNSLDACQQQQPSIVNTMAAGCEHAEDSLTDFDLAFLQGVYKMSADRGLIFQQNDIADVMADTLRRAK